MTTAYLLLTLAFLLAAFLFWKLSGLGKYTSDRNKPDSLTPEQLKRYVGRTGYTLNVMAPIGKVDFNGTVVDAILAKGIVAKKGELVRAIGINGSRLLVVPANMKVIPAQSV